MKKAKASVFLMSLCTGAFAQILPGMGVPAAQSAPPAQNTDSNQSSGGNYSYSWDSGTFERGTTKVFDFDSDSIDLENGTLFWKGKTFEIGNSRAVRARFERYLATNLDDANFQDYQRILNEIAGILSANSLANDSVRLAWQRLYDAAEYDIDGDGSLTIANTVYNVLRMRDEFKAYKITETDTRKARETTERRIDYFKNMQQQAQDRYAQNSGTTKESSDLRKKPPTAGNARIERNTADLARQVANEAVIAASIQALGAQSVLQFQSQIMSFLLARKFQHVAISSSFYRHLYKGSSQGFEVGKDEFAKFFPMSNFMPSNDIVESLAMEARNDVREGMIAVRNLYDSGQRYTAIMRLMETFALGENEPAVRSFDYEKKKVLHDLYRDMSAIKDMGDNRDFAGIIEILERMKDVAPDFPYREIMSKIRTAQQASNLKIMAARAAAFAGDTATAQQYIKEATEIWPLNPELDKFTGEVMDATIGVSKYAKRFDELVEKQSYRDIMGEAAEYAFALKSDPKKSQTLKEIVSNVSQIDFLIAQAKELHTQGNHYIAWEMLEKASQIDPSDPVLARAMASLAPHVGDYVRILARAKQAESRGRYSVALNNYLLAQEIFPTSQECRLGIERSAENALKGIKAEE